MSKALKNKVKLNDIVSVKDFGAVGDGVADDTAAIQAAIAAADVIELPTGTYKVSQIVLTGSGSSAIFGKTLRGSGLGVVNIVGYVAGTSVIRFGTTGGWVDEANLQNYRADYCSLENINISATAAYTYGIECQWMTNASWKNVNISAGATIGNGVYLDFSWDNDFVHLTITAPNGLVCGAHSPNRNTFHGSRFSGGGAGGGTKYGVDVAGTGNSFFGCDISGYDYGLVSSYGGYGLTFHGGYFESNTYDVNLGGASIHGVSFVGCGFRAGVGANIGIRQNGAGQLKGLSVNSCAFQGKTTPVVLTASTFSAFINGNSYISCTNPITKAGTTNFVEDGDGVMQPLSGQLKFPSTQNPSSDATTLDDYREGTFVPTANSLTVVPGGGSVSYSGRYIKTGKLVFYSIQVTPTGGATTASTAGTTFFSNMPFNEVGFNGSLQAVDGGLNSFGVGLVLHSGITRAYTPTWSARTSQILINGCYEASA